MDRLKQTSKQSDLILRLFLYIPVVWAALLIAQSMGGGLPELLSKLTAALEQEINRLEHYVALLEPRQTEVIRRTFFDSQSLPEICKGMGYSTKTVRAIRNHAIEELAAMYAFAAGVI